MSYSPEFSEGHKHVLDHPIKKTKEGPLTAHMLLNGKLVIKSTTESSQEEEEDDEEQEDSSQSSV
jgi:hypothetical protein